MNDVVNEQIAKVAGTSLQGERSPQGTLVRFTSYFDAAALVTLFAAGMYFIGYCYHVSYLRAYGLTTDFFHKDATEHIVQAWESAFWFLMFLSAFLFLKAFFGEALPESAKAWFNKNVPKFVLSIGWMVAFLVFILAAARMEQKGYRDAVEQANARQPVTVTTISDTNLPNPLYFLHYGDGKYVFYYRATPDSKPTIILLRSEDVRRIDFPGNQSAVLK